MEKSRTGATALGGEGRAADTSDRGWARGVQAQAIDASRKSKYERDQFSVVLKVV